MVSRRKNIIARSLIHKTAMTVVALAVAAFATSLINADVVVMNQPISEDIFSDDLATTGYDGSGLTVDISSGDVTMSLRGTGGPGPYIATEPIRIIEGSRALTTAFYSGGGGGRPYFRGSASNIPEPSSLALLGLGAAGLLTLRKRRC